MTDSERLRAEYSQLVTVAERVVAATTARQAADAVSELETVLRSREYPECPYLECPGCPWDGEQLVFQETTDG